MSTMSTIPEDIFSNYGNAIVKQLKSENVDQFLKSFDNLKLTPGDLRREEPNLKSALETTKYRIQREEEIFEELTSEVNKLELEHLDLLKEKGTIEVSIEEKRNEKIPCKEDEDRLNKIRNTLRLYKDITFIRWDYSAPENLIKGYICSHQKNYIHAFEIPLNDSEAVDKVWKKIENASLKSSNESKGKENVCENKKI